MMQINWVLSSTVKLDPDNIKSFKNIGPLWGSWRTWRQYNTDNVICYDLAKSRELLSRAFQAVCNFYVPNDHYQDLGRPANVKCFQGTFKHEVEYPEDIVALHLAQSQSDIVLLIGFDLSTPKNTENKLQQHQQTNFHGLMHSAIANSAPIQWVLVDTVGKLDPAYQNLSNLTCDSLDNVLKFNV